VPRLFATMIGLYAWAAQFTVVYGVTAVACARGFARAALLGLGVVPLTVVATTLVALAATGIVLARSLGERRRSSGGAPATDRFLNYSTILISGLSLVAIAWTGLPAFLVPACG
jgi:hypothetical protein